MTTFESDDSGGNAENIESSDDDKKPFNYNGLEAIIHDLKSPVSSILFALQALRLDGLDKPEREQLFDITEKHCIRIMDMIKMLVLNEKLINGRIAPDFKNYNIVDLTETAAHTSVPLVIRRKKRIIFDTNTDEKIMAVDKMLFERMMYNLISNAIQYSPPDGVIRVDFIDCGDTVRIEVSDEGCGIDDELKPILFDRYVSSDKNTDSYHSGIGLSIVKELTAILGGQVYVKENSLSFGTTMCVELDVKVIDNMEVIQDSNAGLYVDSLSVDFMDIL